MPQLVIVNTNGLTGAEILCAEIARLPGVFFLPGQNFIQAESLLYRPHDFSGRSAAEVFEVFSRHQFTKAGRCWGGLTKHMSPEQRNRYDPHAHCELFAEEAKAASGFLDWAQAFAASYARSMGYDPARFGYLGFFGHNFLLNAPAYPDFAGRIALIHWTNGIYFWLAMISQRMTWNCVDACKFWIVSNLLVGRYAATHPRFLLVRAEDYIHDLEKTIRQVKEFLGPKALVGGGPTANLGYLQYKPEIMQAVIRDAEQFRRIYSGPRLFALAERFDEWAPKALADSRVLELLGRFQRYWNSGAHTNFDWIGPVEEELVELCLEKFGKSAPGRKSLSYRFYQDYHELNSDCYDEPKSRARHELGILEEEIEIPLMPYFLSVCIEYLAGVARGYLKVLHSYRPIREGVLFRKLQAESVQRAMQAFGQTERYAVMLALVAETEQSVAEYEALMEKHRQGLFPESVSEGRRARQVR